MHITIPFFYNQPSKPTQCPILGGMKNEHRPKSGYDLQREEKASIINSTCTISR